MLGWFMGLCKIVALDEGSNSPPLLSLDTVGVMPPNTDNKLSMAAAFNAKPMSTKKVIHAGRASGLLLSRSPILYGLECVSVSR